MEQLLVGTTLALSACTNPSDGDSSPAESEATSGATALESDAGGEPESDGGAMGETGVTEGPTSGDGDGNGDGDVPKGLPAGVYGGGPFYNDADTVLPRMKASGFNTLVLWTIHVENNGDLILNDVPLISDAQWVADKAWPGMVEDLKIGPTTVTRVEFGVGSAGVPDFERIANLIASEGTGPESILYRNFELLKELMPSVDAINFDDESAYDVDPSVAFSLMLGDLGYQISIVPYQASNFWTALYDQVETEEPGLIDRVMLQMYAGGANNNIASWNGLFGELPIEAGLWSKHGSGCSQGDSPDQVAGKLAGYGAASVGGWMWLLDDMLACESSYSLEQYAAAIHGVYD